MIESSGYSRPAVSDDLAAIAHIHLAAFPGFFLSQLGHRFLCVMYNAFLSSSFSVFMVYVGVDGQLKGFAVGALQQGNQDRRLAWRFLPQFVWAVLPALLRRPGLVVNRLAARFFEVGESPDFPQDAVVLRSIGVLPSARGGDASVSLLTAFEVAAKNRSATRVCLTTDAENNERAQKFYQRQGYEVTAQFRQDSHRSMWMMTKCL